MDVLDITAPEIRLAVSRLQLKYRDRKLKGRECITRAYDAIARIMMNSGVALNNQQLRENIPAAVLEVALEFGWAANPGRAMSNKKRHIYNPSAWIPQDRDAVDQVSVEIPDRDMTVQLGRCK